MHSRPKCIVCMGNLKNHENSVQKWVSPGPCMYPKDLPKFGEELQKREKKKHGVFGITEQYPAVHTERIYLSTLSQCPRPVVLINTHLSPSMQP